MIRQATISDKDIIRDMIIKSYIYHCNVCPSFYKKVKTNPKKYYIQSKTLVDRIDIKTFYILELNKNTIGTIMVWDNHGEITLTNLYIDKKYRGVGYGKILLKHVISKINTKYCVLGVYEENKKSVEFYYNFGFKLLQIESTDSGNLIWLKYDKID